MDIPTLNRDALVQKWHHVLAQTDGIFTWTSQHELAFLAECASHATSICEIGSYHGKSAKVMALANPEAHIICIDCCENEDVIPTFAKNLSRQIEAGQVQFINGTSEWLKKNTPMVAFDLCFIDGGHLFHHFDQDIKLILPCMAKGALVTGHDWRQDMNDGVNRGVLANFPLPHVFESIWHVKLP